jgi:hypothetical protein
LDTFEQEAIPAQADNTFNLPFVVAAIVQVNQDANETLMEVKEDNIFAQGRKRWHPLVNLFLLWYQSSTRTRPQTQISTGKK